MATLQVPVAKAKGHTIDIDPDLLPDDVYKEALLQGLKVLLGRGMSKITKAAYTAESAAKNGFDSPEAEMSAAAVAKAEANKTDLLAGKVRKTGVAKTKSGLSREVTTEAMRIARGIIKDELRKAGMKISHVKASDITAAAKELVASNAEIVAQAEQNLKERAAVPTGIDIKALIQVDPKLVAAAEEKKAKSKADSPLSKTQAGKVAPRAKKPNAPQANA